MSVVTVDAMGDACPIPVVKTLKAMENLQEDAVIETHVDNEIAVQNLTRLAQSKNFEVKSEKLDEKHYVVYASAYPLEETPTEPESCAPEKCGNTVVAIDTACMGRGNDELGRVLMKGFIYAISQQEELPKTILFYNGGAAITTDGSASLEDLKSMEAQGVEILTCGTCLNYYGLTDKLCVGTVTNMYTIAEKLTGASKVVKP